MGKVTDSGPGDYSKVVAAFVGRYNSFGHSSCFDNKFRLEVFDIPTSLEVLLVLKDLLEQTEIPPGIFINDTMITALRLIYIYVHCIFYIKNFV